MRKWAILLSLALLLGAVLWGCAGGQSWETAGPVLWFAGDIGNDDDWSSDTRAVAWVPYPGDELSVDGLMAALLAGPDRDSGLTSPFPEGARLLGWRLEENGLLWVDLSDEYGGLKDIGLTLADYCITLTLSQLEGVERVKITVNGRLLSSRYRQDLSGEQAIFSGVEEEPVEVSATLYFPRTGGRGLGVERRVFQLTEDDVLAEIVTRALMDGPEGDDLSNFLPEGTELRGLRMEDDVCLVDFSEQLLTGMPEEEERQTLLVYAIVNSLGNLSSVTSVRLLVEGEPLTSYGVVALPGPLEPDFGLVGSA